MCTYNVKSAIKLTDLKKNWNIKYQIKKLFILKVFLNFNAFIEMLNTFI